MECFKCGANVNDGDNFCEECGASLKKAPPASNPIFQESKRVVYDKNLAVATNIGRRHPTNEDDGTVLKGKNGEDILIVSDGVSSSFSATKASQMAIDEIQDILVKDLMAPRELIISAIREADTSIKSLPFETREDGIYGPEATVVVAKVKDGTATIGWVGDSRAYVFRGDKQELLTVDDSWAEMVVSEGSMTIEEAMQDKRAHYVTQVLGMHDQEAEIHTLEYQLETGDILLLCSDGLWNYFQGENALLRAIEAFGINSDAIHICEHLVSLANLAGGHDNITVAMLRVQ